EIGRRVERAQRTRRHPGSRAQHDDRRRELPEDAAALEVLELPEDARVRVRADSVVVGVEAERPRRDGGEGLLGLDLVAERERAADRQHAPGRKSFASAPSAIRYPSSCVFTWKLPSSIGFAMPGVSAKLLVASS